jgi:hypothetical protein
MQGFRFRVKDSESTIGRNQPTVQVQESQPVVLCQLVVLFVAIYLIVIFAGYCPYVEYEKDLYHGGDPAEYIGQDILILMYFLIIANFLTGIVFRETLYFWKEPGFEDPNRVETSRSNLQSQTSNPYNARHQVYASLLVSISSLTVALSIIIMDSQYKLDAGMEGRIMYLIGFFYGLEAVSSTDLYLIILDGRFRQVILERIACVLIALGAYAIYMSSMVYWLLIPNDLRNNTVGVPRFDLLILVASIGLAYIKRIILYIYKKHTVTLLEPSVHQGAKSDQSSDEQQENPDNEPQEADLGDQDEDLDMPPTSSLKQASSDVKTKMDETVATVGPCLKMFDDIAEFTKVFFVIWVLFAVIWNGLGVLLLLGVMGKIERLVLLEAWIKKDGQGALNIESGHSKKPV